MNKHLLFKKISKIHAIKCDRSYEYCIAVSSMNTLNALNSELLAVPEEGSFSEIEKKVDDWANSNPIAPEGEILRLLKKPIKKKK